MTFGEKLKELREKRGLSQEDLSIILEIPRPTIAHYESNSLVDVQRFPRQDRIKKIADFFNVSIDYLLGENNENNGEQYWKQRTFDAERKNDELTEIVDYFTKAFNDLPTMIKVMIQAQKLMEED